MTLSEKAYTYMKNNISNYRWLPGQAVREQDIANELEISRTPVRQAFNRLIDEGYLIKEENKGVVVAQLFLTKKDFQERMEFLELMLLNYFQKLQTNEFDFPSEELESALREMESEITNEHTHFIQAEAKFWHILLQKTENSYSKSLILQTFQTTFHQKGYIERVLSGSRKDKYTHLRRLTDYLSENNYPYVRREIRILFNQLILNIFQGSRDMSI